MRRLPRRFLNRLGYDLVQKRPWPWDFDHDPEAVDLLERVAPYTMVWPTTSYGLIQAIRYVHDRPIDGDIVECGVWRGGQMMLAASMLAERNVQRRLWLFDTFTGMSEPTDADVKQGGLRARDRWVEGPWCDASLDEVRANMASTGYPDELVRYVPGKVEDTLSDGPLPEQIAILRLDTDWYESTKVELELLFPRIAPGGVVISDDYGTWQGARRAIDEYVAEHDVRLLWSRLDESGRMAIVL